MNIKLAMFSEDRKWDRVLFVDPGIIGTGCAFWKTIERGAEGKATAPDITDVLTPHIKASWDDRVRMLCAWFHGVVHSMKPKYVIIEFPELWSGSAVSQASASTGSLFKLTYLVGAYGEIVRNRLVYDPVLISPNYWKGQLTKDAVHARIARALDKVYSNHIADAVGMGLAVQGKL